MVLFFSGDMKIKFGIDVIWDKFLKEEEVDERREEVPEIKKEEPPKSCSILELDIFSDAIFPKVVELKVVPLVFSLDFEVFENISFMGIQLVSRSTKLAKYRSKR